jgi:hypothetical protein
MFATSGRAQVAYESTGPAPGAEGGAEVLLVHSGVNDRRSWRHVIDSRRPGLGSVRSPYPRSS